MTDDLRRRYLQAGFGGSVRRGRRPALIVVDFTRGFTDPDGQVGADMSSEIEVTNTLICAARNAGTPVIFTAIAFPHGASYAWLEKAPGLAVLKQGSAAVEIDPRLSKRAEDPVVTKTGASGFFGTDLATLLRGYEADTVLVCGATTSGCVRATAVDAVQHGFPTLVIADAVADRIRASHDNALVDLQAKYADVVTSDDATSYLRQTVAPSAHV